jgi:MFS family permease
VSRWTILGVIVVARVTLGFSLQAGGSAAPFLATEFGIDHTETGILVGFFLLPGIVFAIPAGIWGKRYGDKRMVVAGIVLVAIGGMLSASAPSFPGVVAGRVVSGIGATFVLVLMNKMIIDWFSSRELVVGMSLFLIGWPLGIAIGQMAQAPLATIIGWRTMVALAGVLTLGGALAVARWYRASPDSAIASADPSAGRISGAEIWLVSIAGMIWTISNSAYLVMITFVPTLLVERGASLEAASAAASLLSWVFVVAMPLSAWIATRWQAVHATSIAGLAVGALAAMAINWMPWPAALIALHGFAMAFAMGLLGSLPARVLRAENRSTGIGIYYVWFYAGQPILVAAAGAINDAAGSAWPSPLSVAAMVVACVALLIVLQVERARLLPRRE